MKQEYLEDTVIETGIIVDVDVKNWTVDLGTQHSDKQLFGVPWCSPYLHPETGEGINFMPEVGAQCLLCTPADGELSPFVIGYMPIPLKESYRTKRIDMNPGDIAITTRDGNFVVARRGGVVQIGSTKLAQRLYLPVGNTILDFVQNYGMHAVGGDWTWEVDPDSKTAEGTPARWLLKAKRNAEDTDYAVTLTVGTTLPNDDADKRDGEPNLKKNIVGAGSPLVELDIRLPNKVGFNLAVDGDGNVFAKSGGSVGWDLSKDWIARIGGNYAVNVTGTHTTKAAEIVEEAPKHKATWGVSEEKFTQKFLLGDVTMGNTKGGSQRSIQGDNFLNLLAVPGVFKITLPNGAPILCEAGPAFSALRSALSSSVKIGK